MYIVITHVFSMKVTKHVTFDVGLSQTTWPHQRAGLEEGYLLEYMLEYHF